MARKLDRRRTDTQVYLAGAGVADQLHHAPGRRAADNRVVDHHHALALEHVAYGIELELYPCLAEALVRLDERSTDIAVLHQAFGERDARFTRIADGGGSGRVGHADNDVRVDRILARELGAHFHPQWIHAAIADDAIRTSEVDVFEDAERVAFPLHRLRAVKAACIDDDHFARLDLALVDRAEMVQRTRLGRDHPAVAQTADAERPITHRVAHGDHRVGGEDYQTVRAFEAPHHCLDPFRPGVTRGGADHAGDQLRIGGGSERMSLLFQSPPEKFGVDEVAVVAERYLAPRADDVDRLGVADAAGARGRVARMSDRDAAGQVRQVLFLKHVAHEPHAGAQVQVVAV